MLLREVHGTAAAVEAIETHHEVFRKEIAPVAAVTCVQQDECFAIFEQTAGAAMTTALESFLAACAKPLSPDTAVGMALGDFANPADFGWRDAVSHEDVAAARSLARIAQANQVLATHEVCEETGSEPIVPIGAEPVERRLHGLQAPLTVVIGPWGDRGKDRIYNLPMLRPELKKLENGTANILMSVDEIRASIDALLERKSGTALGSVQRVLKRFHANVSSLVAKAAETSELRHLPGDLMVNLSELQTIADNLLSTCSDIGDMITKGQTDLIAVEMGLWDDALAVIRDVHVEADQWIMDIDDGLKVGQPPAWRH